MTEFLIQMRNFRTLITWLFLVATCLRVLAEDDPQLALSKAISEIENRAHDTPRWESERRLLALLERYSTPSQQEDILRAAGLLFHQRYNDDLEKADYQRAAEYFRKALAVRGSYREAMLWVRGWLLQCYDELKDSARYEDCLGDILYLDPEWIFRDEYDPAFLRNYLTATYRDGSPIPENSLTFKEIRWSKLRRLHRDARENYDKVFRPGAVQTEAMRRFRLDGMKSVREWLEYCRRIEDAAAVEILEKWIADR